MKITYEHVIIFFRNYCKQPHKSQVLMLVDKLK